MGYKERRVRRAVKSAVKKIIKKHGRMHTMGVAGRRGQGAALYTNRTSSLRVLEKKSVDVNPFTITIDNAGDFVLLNGTQIGAAFWNRIGNEINMLSVHVVGQICTSGVALASIPAGGLYFRMILVYDRQPNGGPFAINDLINSYNLSGIQSATSLDHLNPNNKDLFLILRDNRIATPDVQGIGGATSQQAMSVVDYTKNDTNINMYVPLRGLKARYKTSTGGIGDLTIGALWLFFLGPSNTSPTQTPYSFSGSARVTFVD